MSEKSIGWTRILHETDRACSGMSVCCLVNHGWDSLVLSGGVLFLFEFSWFMLFFPLQTILSRFEWNRRTQTDVLFASAWSIGVGVNKCKWTRDCVNWSNVLSRYFNTWSNHSGIQTFQILWWFPVFAFYRILRNVDFPQLFYEDSCKINLDVH